MGQGSAVMIQNIQGFGQLYIQSDLNGGMPAAAGSAPAAAIAEPQDRVTLSKEAQNAKNDNGTGGSKGEENLSSDEKQQVNELKRRDAEVKAHEQAHMAAGGGVVQGGASYEYQRGPDGRTYAVGGEVQIDMSAENTPEATIAKMQQVQRAALAPAQPSGTDRAVAARAAQVEARARAEKTQASAPATETIEPEPSPPPDGSLAPTSPDRSEKYDFEGGYGPQWSQRPQSWKSTGRQIDLQA
ncbi:MAG: hypothetical protein HY911_04880 [Desulfobacterales bacterium]|nr:hypothetical protein [Desulfobacterales bacterium]